MSKSIDERVVELRFDNKQFEEGASQSMSTLDKLKEKLNFKGAQDSFKKIDNASSSLKFTVLSNAVETVHAKFSALEIVGITALQRITNQAIDTGERLAKSLSIDQISAGWEKYNSKNSSVQTIANSTGKTIEEVEGYLAKLMWFSDETSYSFTDMTSSLATLTAAGADIDKIIPMITGIANATAFAGKGSAEFSRSIYNLNQSYSAGYLQYMDWKSLQNAGTASKQLIEELIKAGEEVGTIQKGEVAVDSFISSISGNGGNTHWATTEVMEKAFAAFSEYSEKVYDETLRTGKLASDIMDESDEGVGTLGRTAFEAAQNAKSLQDAIEATKDAVSTGWLRTFDSIFGNLNEAKKLWRGVTDSLYTIFAEGAEGRNNMLSLAFDSSWNQIKERMTNAGIDMEDFSKRFLNVYKYFGRDSEEQAAVKSVLADIEAGVKTIDDLFEADKTGFGTARAINEVLQEYADTIQVAAGSTDDLSDRLSYFQNVVDRVWSGEFKNAPERFQLLADAGYDYVKVQRLVDLTENGRKLTLEDLNDEEFEAIGYTKEQVAAIKALAEGSSEAGVELKGLLNELGRASGRELLRDSILTTLESVADVVSTIRDSVLDAIGLDYNSIYNFIDRIKDFTESIKPTEETLEHISNLVGGIVSFVSSLGKLFSGAFRFGLNVVRTILDEVGFSMGGLADSTGNVLSGIAGFLDSIDPFGTLFDWLEPKIRSVTGWFVQLFEAIKNSSVVASVVDTINTAVSNLKGKFEGFDLSSDNISFQDKIAGIFEAAKAAVLDFKDNAITYLTEFKNKVVDIVSNFSLRNILDAFGDGKQKIEDFVTTVSSTSDKFPGFLEGVKTALGNFVAGTGTVAEDTAAVFGGMWQGVRDAIDDGFGGKALVGGSLIVSLLGITSAVKGIANAAKAIANPVQLFTDSVTKILKPITNSIDIMAKASIIRAVAMVILSLAASFYVIASIDVQKFQDARSVLDEFLTIVAVLFAIVSTNSLMSQIATKAQVFTSAAANLTTANIGKQMFEVALSFIAIAAAFKILDTINPDNLWRNAGIMALSLVAIGATIGILGSITELVEKGTIKAAIGNKLAGLPGIGKIFGVLGYDSSNKSPKDVKKSVDSVGSQIFKIAASVIAITVALKLISKINDASISKSLGVLLKIAIGTAAFVYAISKFGNNNLEGASKLFDGLGKALLKMTIALGIISLIGPGDAAKAALVLGMLGIIAGFIEGVGFIFAKTKDKQYLNPGTIKNSETMFKGLGVALLEMAIAIAIISSIDAVDAYKAVGVLAILGIVIGAIEALTTHFGTTLKQGESQARLGGSVIISIATALLMLSVAMIALSTLNTGELLSTFGVISFLLLEIGAIIVLTTALGKDNKSKGTAATIAALDVALGLLLGMLLVIAKTAEPEELEAATKAIGIALGTLALLVAATKIPGGGFKNSIGAIGSATLVVGLLGLILSLMVDNYKGVTQEEINSMTKLLIVTAGLVAALSAVFGVLSKWVGETNFKKGTDAYAGILAAVIGMAAAVGAVVILANAIGPALEDFSSSNIDDSKIGAFAATMGVLVGATALIAAAMVALIKIGVVDSGTNNQMKILQAAEFMGLAGVIVVAITALWALVTKIFSDAQLDSANVKSITDSIMAAIGFTLVVAGAMAILVATGLASAGQAALWTAVEYIAVAAIVIDAIVVLWAGVAKLVESMNISDINKVSDVVGSIGTAFGSLIGNFYSNIIEKIGNAFLDLLNGFCKVIREFGDAGRYFIDRFKGIDSSAKENVQIVTDSILKLIGAQLINSIVSFITGPLKVVGMLGFLADLKLLGQAAVDFTETISGQIKPEDANTASTAATMIKDLADGLKDIQTNPLKAFSEWISGGSGAESFGEDIATLADGILQFVDVFKKGGVTDADVQAGVDAVQIASGLFDIIPAKGGFFELFTGSEAEGMSAFAENIGKLGKGLAQFSQYVGTGGTTLDTNHLDDTAKSLIAFVKFDKDAFQEGITALTSIAQVPYPDTGWFGIEDDVGQFASNLAGLGKGLADFYKAIKDENIDWFMVTSGIMEIGNLALATSTAEDSISYTPLEIIADNLDSLGTGLSTLWTNIKDIPNSPIDSLNGFKKIENSVVLIDKLGEVYKSLSTVTISDKNPFIKSWSGYGESKSNFDKFIESLGNVGNAIKSYYEAISTTYVGADGSEGSARRNAKSLLEVFSGDDTTIADAMSNSASALGSVADALGKAAAIEPKTVENFANSFNNLAHMSITKFVTGIGDEKNKELILNAIDNAVTDWSSHIVDPGNGEATPSNILGGAFDKLGRQAVDALSSSIDTKYSSSTGVGTIITKLNKQLSDLRQNKKTEGLVGAFTLMGHDAADELAASISTRLTAYVSGNIPDGGVDYYESIVELGRDFARGFAKGIADPEITADMLEKVGDMVYAAADTIAKTQKSHSPSKVTEKLGQFFSQGFINGILSKGGVLKDAITNFVNGGSDGISGAVSKALDLINNGVDTNPTITPVLNLDEITSGIGDMNSMFDNSMGTIDIEGYLNNASLDTLSGFDVNGLDYNINEYLTSQNGVASAAPAETVFNYTQNNYSPKSLSNLDIYRNTKNQLASLKKGLALNA